MTLQLTEFVTVAELANMMNANVNGSSRPA